MSERQQKGERESPGYETLSGVAQGTLRAPPRHEGTLGRDVAGHFPGALSSSFWAWHRGSPRVPMHWFPKSPVWPSVLGASALGPSSRCLSCELSGRDRPLVSGVSLGVIGQEKQTWQGSPWAQRQTEAEEIGRCTLGEGSGRVFLFWVPGCLPWVVSGRGGGHVWDHLVISQVAKRRSSNMP